MQWATSERRGANEVLRGEPCQVQPSWNAPPPAGTSTGQFGLDTLDGGGLAQLAVGVVGSMKLVDHPPMTLPTM